MTKFIIHVGLPKCGSTTLQKILSQSLQVGYLGKNHGSYCNQLIEEYVRNLAVFSDARLFPIEKYRRAFSAEIDKAPIAVLSDEILSSIGFGAFWQGNSFPQILDNLIALNIPFDIMLVIREQRSFLQSYYKQLVLRGVRASYDSFVRLILERPGRWIYPVLNYPVLIELIYRKNIRLHLFPFELLFTNNNYFLWAIESIGVICKEQIIPHERKTPGDAEIVRDRVSNKEPYSWLCSPMAKRHVFPDVFSRRKSTQDPQAVAAIDEWAESNRMGMLEKRISAGTLTELDPAVEDRLIATLVKLNKSLKSLIPEVDWGALGYAV